MVKLINFSIISIIFILFGSLLAQLENLKFKKIWNYPVVAGEFSNEKKNGKNILFKLVGGAEHFCGNKKRILKASEFIAVLTRSLPKSIT